MTSTRASARFWFARALLALLAGIALPLMAGATDIVPATTIAGDFNGDGRVERAVVILTQQGQGNPVEDGTPDEYEVRILGAPHFAIKAGCCEILLVPEGDLDGDGADDLTLFQAPVNGCTYSLQTYTQVTTRPRKIVDSMISTGCDPFDRNGLKDRVTREGDAVYELRANPNDPDAPFSKVRVL